MTKSHQSLSRLVSTVFALTMLLSACSDGNPTDDDVTATGDDTIASTTGETTTTAAPSDDGGSDDAATTSTEPDTTTEATAADDIDGEAWDGFASDGDLFGVVGVAHDDVLNVRELPDAGSDIVSTLGPTETGVEATGEGWIRTSSIWYEVNTADGVGWVNARFVSFMGGSDDATAEYLATDSPSSAASMPDLADAIADAFIINDDIPTRVVQVVAPTEGDLAEITYDVIGLGDDAVGGYRLHIFGNPDEGDGYGLKSIERTYLCSRGSDGDACM